MGPRGRTALGWGVVVLVAAAASQLLPLAVMPLVRLTAAHSDPVAAVLVMLVQLALWVAVLAAAVAVAARIMR